jgi:hypothetical protein
MEQQFLPAMPTKRLYPVHFCRECGHEYHPVLLPRATASARSCHATSTMPPRARRRGATPRRETTRTPRLRLPHPHPSDCRLRVHFDDEPEDYPEPGSTSTPGWQPRLKATTECAASASCRVCPTARSDRRRTARGSSRANSASACAAATTHRGSARDRTRLASLSAEGRSSATTVLVASVLRWMHGVHSQGSDAHAQAPRLHRQPPGRRAAGRPLQRLPVREPDPRGFPRRARPARRRACAATSSASPSSGPGLRPPDPAETSRRVVAGA